MIHLLLSLLFSSVFCLVSTSNSVILTIGYCPTDFSTRAASVLVNVETGDFKILGHYKIPGAFACQIEATPVPTPGVKPNTIFLNFDSTTGFVEIDTASATVIGSFKSGDLFFVGYTTYLSLQKDQLLGVQGTVTQHGLCNDGCFELGTVDVSKPHRYHNITNLLFKASMPVSFYSEQTNRYFVQASYDLRETSNPCSKDSTELCLWQVNTMTGEIESVTYTPWPIYGFGPTVKESNGTTVVSFFEGSPSLCGDGAYGFANVDLSKASLDSVLGCLSNHTIIDTDEWVNSFHPAGDIFVTSSGDAEAGAAQLLVLKTSGEVILNTKLEGLGKALGAMYKMFDVWSVNFVQ